MTYPTIKSFASACWASESAAFIQAKVEAILESKGGCSVMLTGGRSAAELYLAWARLPRFGKQGPVAFYFGDERCVPQDDPESNFGMVMRTLFADGVPNCATIHPMDANGADLETTAERYAELLPECIDVLLLSTGEDGHIASLFPYSAPLFETKRKVIPVIGSKNPCRRLTVTPPVIQTAKSTFVLSIGTAKAAIIDEARLNPDDFASFPARLVLNATWMRDIIAST